MSASRTSADSSKRQKTCHEEGDEEGDEDKDSETHRHPRSFVTWNCNGLTSRSARNVADLKLLLKKSNRPDMICMQEVRLAATGPIGRQRGIPKNDSKNYRGPVQDALTNVFGDYKPFWSLADKKYAGTLTLIHQRCLVVHVDSHPAINSPSSKKEASSSNSFNEFAAFTPKSAIDLILRRLGKTRQDCGLSQSPASKMQQTSMTSFFAPKTAEKTSSSSFNNGTSSSKSLLNNNCHDHHTEGRFQFFFFPDMDVVHTYVPNNGTDDDSFQRRRDWDENLLQFWKDRRQVLDSCSNSASSSGIISKDRKLLWCGDMNVARDYRDGTHWEQRRGTIYEWWTDESKCLSQYVYSKDNSTKNKKPENMGMPSFTPAERLRFNKMLQQADFCDAWRELHPNAGALSSRNDSTNPWDLPNYTWRGPVAEPGKPPARYQGRGQRLDYFLLSPSNRFSLESCEILTNEEGKEGLFCGSDHCAVSLKI